MKTDIKRVTTNGHDFPEAVVLLWFSAEWCGPCKQMSPVIEMFEHANSSKLRVLKLGAEDDFELAQVFGVRAVPTLILLERNKQLATHVGALSYNELDKWVKSQINQ